MNKNNYFTPVLAALAALLVAAALIGLAGCEQPGGIPAGQETNGDNTTPGSFTVSFDSRGGSPAASQTVAKGGAASKPSPDPSREGYTFAGWFTGAAADAEDWSFSGDTVSANITLYARWKPSVVLVNFDSGEGTFVETQAAAKGAAVPAPSPPPTRDGYVLDGWYKDAERTELWDFDTDTVAGTMTLYAKWTPAAAGTFPVTFDSRGGTYIRNQSAAKGGTVSRPSPDPLKPGYVFDGWYKDAGATAAWDFSADTVTAPVTLYAAWSSAGQISGAADLAKIGVDPRYPRNGSYTLAADVTLSNWTPLCADSTRAFSGTFDGGGHTITLESFNPASVSANDYVGIFGYVKGASYTEKAEIKNVNIVSSVNAVSPRDTGQAIGLLAGYANRTEIGDITLTGSLTVTVKGKAVVNVGGAAGWIEYRTVLKNSDSSMTIDVTGGYDAPIDPNIVVYSSVGAFVGLFKHESEITNCHNTGSLTGRGTGPTPDDEGDLSGPTTDDPHHAQVYVGGIAGSGEFNFATANSGFIKDCSSTGDITAAATGWWAFAAGISSGSGRITKCTASGRLSAYTNNYPYAYAGGINAYAIGDWSITNCHFGGKIIDNSTYYAKAPIDGHGGGGGTGGAGSSGSNTWDAWLE